MIKELVESSVTKDQYDVPIVLFVFRRLETVQLIIEQISKVKPQTLYVFADGARESVEGELEKVQSVREYLKESINWECTKRLYFYDSNKGCDKNIRDGLDLVFSEQEMAVVFEDDAVPVQDFFWYAEELLKKYKEKHMIQYIAGFNAVGDNSCIDGDYSFGKTAPMSGAFATWANRWNGCDFELTNWPKNKREKRFRKVFYSYEIWKKYENEFDEAYEGIITAWDVKFLHDMLDKDRVAIVPSRNLATSYGYTEGAFHPQEKREAVRLLKIMSATNKAYDYPLKTPDDITTNVNYDYLRQRYMLSVKGNYVERRLRYIYLQVKGVAYKLLPARVWNAIKDIKSL